MKASLDFDLCNSLHRVALRYTLDLLDGNDQPVNKPIQAEEKPKATRSPRKTKADKTAQEQAVQTAQDTQPVVNNPFATQAPQSQTTQTTTGGFVIPASTNKVFEDTQAPPSQNAPIQGASADAMAASGNLYQPQPVNAPVAPTFVPQVSNAPGEYSEANLRAVFVAKANSKERSDTIMSMLNSAGFSSFNDMDDTSKRAFYNFLINMP